MCSLDKILLTFALLHFVHQGKHACYSRYLLTTHFCNQIHYDERGIFFFFFLVLVLEGVVGLSSFLDGCVIEWFALERNRDHSVIFVIEPKYCILGSYHLLLVHVQFTLIDGPNIPGP